MKVLLLISMISLFFTSSAYCWQRGNSPFLMDKNYETQFDLLPLAAELTLDYYPWASSYWPRVYGNIAYRWNGFYVESPVFEELHYKYWDLEEERDTLQGRLNAPEASRSELYQTVRDIERIKNELKKVHRTKATHYKKYFFDFKRPSSKKDILAMSIKQRESLSPAEKYDIYVGNYSFKLTQYVLKESSHLAQTWEGICDGWSSAAIEFKEPKPITLKNRDGIDVSFGSSDLKALASYYHSAMTNNTLTRRKMGYGRVGKKCDVDIPWESWFVKNGVEYYTTTKRGVVKTYKVPKKCADVNPGAFHIVLTNQIGIKNRSFVVDVVSDQEVWNQPVFEYYSEVLEDTTQVRRGATRKTARQVRVYTEMYYTNDGGVIYWGADNPKDAFNAWWYPTIDTYDYRFKKTTYEYYLDINRHGQIIGGTWLHYDRPDFLWTRKSRGFMGKKSSYGIVGYLDNLRNMLEVRD